MFPNELITSRLALYAANNSAAYADNRNVTQAIAAAKRTLLNEFWEQLNELQTAVTAELYADWYVDDIAAAQREALHGFLPRVHAGNTEEVSAEAYDYYLNQLPPMQYTPTGFFFGEPYDHDARQRPITLHFYQSKLSSTGFYCRLGTVAA